MKLATIVIPHCRTPKWLQIVIASIKAFKNQTEFDTVVIDNSPKYDLSSIRALTETTLGEGIIIKDNEYFQARGHAGALDYALSFVETPYYFSAETDARALKDGWLDWFMSYMKDDYVAMAGWFWSGAETDGDREYIHTGGCLYNTGILKRIKKQIQENDNFMICYGKDLKKRLYLGKEKDFLTTISGLKSAGEHYRSCLESPFHGPFTEQRGFQEIWSFRDEKFYQEPGAWPYYRCQIEYECVKLPGVLVWNENPHIAAGTWYGNTVEDAWWVHYWAGTVSHNWEFMKVRERWQRKALPYWIDREDSLWREVVPESIRKKTLEMGLCRTGEDEKQFILNHPNFCIPQLEWI